MEKWGKKVKYKIVIPILLFLRKLILGNNNKNKLDLYPQESQFFILGSGRNGSTLLALLLSQNNDVHLPPEQYVLPYSIMSRHLKFYQKWEAFCKATLKNFSLKNQDWVLEKEDYKHMEDDLINLKKEFRKISNLFGVVIRKYGDKIGKNAILFGDHSPNVTLFYKLIYGEFPGSKYIVLVRNPLDVILSYSKMIGNPASDPVYASWKWNNSINAYHWLLNKPGCNVFLVKYEELVLRLKETLENIFAFLEVDYQSINIVNKEEIIDSLGAKNYAHLKNLYKPVSGNSINKWRKELDRKTIEKVTPLVIENANKVGYLLDVT